MKIECISQPYREGGTIISLPVAGTSQLKKAYHFRNAAADDPKLSAERAKQIANEGPHVADVVDPAHVHRLLAIPEAFREWRAPMTPEEEAAEVERLRAEEAAAAEAAAEADAARIAEEDAVIARQIAHEESMRAAALALRDNQITAAEAETVRSGVPQPEAPAPAPENPTNAIDPMRAQQIVDIEAAGKADRARAEAVRQAGTMTLGDAREAFKAKFQRNPSPRWSVEEIVAKIVAGE